MVELQYCRNFATVRERLTRFHARASGDSILAVMHTPSDPLRHFARTHADGYCDYPDMDERLRFWDEHLRRKCPVFDDSVPSAYLTECDQGLYGGMVGGDVRYMAHPDNGWISSMVPPICHAHEEFHQLAIDEASTAFRRYHDQLEMFGRGAHGKFGLSHFILIDAMNFMFELFGATEAYRIMLFEPEFGNEVCRFALDLNMMVQDRFFEVAMLEGGTCSNMGQWLPGRIVSESVDPYHMTSCEDFDRWGRPWIGRIFEHYDGGIIHIHANGRHLFESICSLDRLKAIWLGDDLDYPSSFQIIGEIRRRTGDMPLIVQCRHYEFREALRRHELPGGVLYEVSGVPDDDEANRLMDEVRAYRA